MKARMLTVYFKTAVMLTTASLLMGNKGCKEKQVQQPANAQRVLKKRIELGQVTSAAFELPGGGKFDFQFAANAQMYDVLMESGKFTMPYNQPVTSVAQSPQGIQKVSTKMTSTDDSLIKIWNREFNQKSLPPPPSEVSCLLNLPQAYIGGSIRSFEMVSAAGVSIGFGSNGSYPIGGFPSASVMVQKAQLELGVVAFSPIRKRLLAAGEASAKQTKIDLNLSINFGNIALGPKYFFQSPLAAVTKKALRTAVDNLVVNLDREPWTTRVRANEDTHLLIEGGIDVGLQKGDELEIYAEDHQWEGEPCRSRYLGSIPSESPISVIKIVGVSDAYSIAEVTHQTDWNPQIADIVKVRALVGYNSSHQ